MKACTEWHGRTSYSEGLELMRQAEAKALHRGEATLLGFEFESSVTMGLRADLKRDLLIDLADLESRRIELHRVDRGGEATLHSPGQLVIYPVINLKALNVGVRDFVRRLEHVTIKTLHEVGVESDHGSTESGIFTVRGKIAFIGLRIRKGVSTHGLALNVSNDTSLFAIIKSCGRALRSHDSLAGWMANPDISIIYRIWCHLFLTSLLLTPSGHHDLSNAPRIGL